MSRIIVIAKEFEEDNAKQLLIDYAFDENTLEAVILPAVHPTSIGAKFDIRIHEWVLDN